MPERPPRSRIVCRPPTLSNHLERPGFLRRTEFIGGTGKVLGRAPPARPALGSRDGTFERGGRRAPRDAERQGDRGGAVGNEGHAVRGGHPDGRGGNPADGARPECLDGRTADSSGDPYSRTRALPVDGERRAGRCPDRGRPIRGSGSGARASGAEVEGETYTGSTAGWRELDEILEDGRFEIGDARRESIREIFVARIEPGRDGREHRVPDGYGENGIWVRGEHDYAEPRVAGAIGTGIWSTMIAWVGEATWVERRIRLVDARRQVAKVRSEK